MRGRSGDRENTEGREIDLEVVEEGKHMAKTGKRKEGRILIRAREIYRKEGKL